MFRHTDKLLVLKWKARRDVHMLSTIHELSMISTRKLDHITNEPIMKPICIKEYNENMGAIDKSDTQISFLECVRKTIKWYKKFFFHLLDVTLYNAFILYKLKTGKTMHLSDFRLEVIRSIIESVGSQKNEKKGRPPLENPMRHTARHFPSLI